VAWEDFAGNLEKWRWMMDFPAQPILFSIPVWIYITVRRRRGGEEDDWTTIRQDIGWQGSDPVYFCGPWA
jgi:hypothetical protein